MSHTVGERMRNGGMSMRKIIRTRRRRAIALCMICAALSGKAYASETLIPVGEVVGIQITLDGALVAAVGPVDTVYGESSPAEEAGLRAGDVITAVNGTEIKSAAELAAAVEAINGAAAELCVTRNGRQLTFTVTPAETTDGSARLGLWLRDGVTGIGTVTYIDPETGAFGALGHGVNDTESGALLPVEEGSICRARIMDVKRGEAGEPGELSGSFQAGDTIGHIEENTRHGLFGVMEQPLAELHEAMPAAEPGEVVSGPATILACVDGGAAKEYAVEIAKAGFVAGDGRDMIIRVTDPELMARTGGIVQGMSGSPVLQNGKLVGAVTHVLVNDPTKGYGIFIENMLDAAG